MPTYNEIVNGHNPFVLMQSNGSSIVDQSANAYSLIPGTSGYTADLIGFRKTVAEHGWRSDDFANGSSIPYFAHTPTSNLFTVSFWIYRPTTGDGRMVTSFGQSKCTVWTSGGLLGINSFSGDIAGFSESLILDGKWHHVAFVFDSNDVANTTRGWLDGVEQILTFTGTPNARPVTGVSQRFLISGGISGSGSEQYQDTISTVHSLAWFNSILTEAQIQEQANHNFGSEINPLTELVMSKKPSAYYKFWDDDPTDQITDQLGVRHLTITGNHTRNTTGLPAEIVNGSSITMQPGGYAESTVDSTFWDIQGLTQWSFEGWIESKALPASASAFFGIGQSSGVYTSLMSRDDMQSFRWEVWNAASFYSEIYKHDLNQLYHVVYTMDTDGRRMYVNGRLVGFTTDLTAPGAATDRFWLNRNPWENQSRHDFDCYEIAIYKDHVLSASEVLNHYVAGIGSGLPEQYYMNIISALSPIAYYPCNVESLVTDKLFDVAGGRTMVLPAGASMDNSGLDGTRAYNHNLANISPVLMPTSGLTTFTLEFWLKVDARPVAQYDVFAGLYNGSTRFDYHSDSNVNVGTRLYNNLNGGDFGSNHNMGDLHRVGKWYHIALTCDTAAGEILTYVDSVLANITPVNSGAIPDLNLILGNLSTNAYPADCSLQHIALYSVVLSATQIKNHYRIKRPLPVETGVYEKSVVADEPVTYLKMNETAGSTLVDTMRGLDGLLNTTPADTLNGLGQNRYHSSDTAIHFDSAAWVDLGDLTWFGCDKKNSGFTMEMLLEFTEVSALNTIIGFAETSGFRFDKDGSLLRWRHVASGTSTFTNQYSTRSVETGKLYHCVVTFDGQFIIVYMNGEEWINADLGANYDANFNTYNKFVMGAQWNVGDVADALSDEVISHFAYYDYVVPKANWMNRTRLVHGDVSASISTPYQDVVRFDQPLVYYPLNDVHANYPSQFSDVGNSDIDTRIAVLDNSGDHFGYETAEIVVGGGGCLDIGAYNPITLDGFDISGMVNNDVSVEAWFNLDSMESLILSHGDSGESLPTNYLFRVLVTSAGAINMFWEYGAGTNELHVLFPAGSVVTGTTYHLVFIRNAATNETYGFLNGVKSSIVNYTNQFETSTLSANNKLRIAGDIDTPTFDGRISHVAIYDKVLTDQQVDDHYQAGIGNPVGAIREVNGTVTERDVPVARKVFIYDRADGSYIAETTSSAVDGTFSVQWRNPDPLKRYMVIVQDDAAGDVFEPIARDNIEAVEV